MHSADDLLSTSFLGPWVPFGNGRRQIVYLSLAHWYEAAKFMPHFPAGRDHITFSPTLKEVQRYARLHQDHWRNDWSLVRPSVLIMGLGLLAIQRPELNLYRCDLELIGHGLAKMRLPVRFADACLERFDVWRRGPRFSFFGADLAPDPVVGQKVGKMVTPLATWTLLSPCNGRTPWRLHDWSITHFVPVQYVGEVKKRMSRPLIERIIGHSDLVVVFEARGSHRHDVAIQVAKSMKRKLSLELYDTQPVNQSIAGLK